MSQRHFAHDESEPAHGSFSRSNPNVYYADERKKRSKMSGAHIAIIAAVLVVAAVVGGALAYINSIQTKLSGDLSEQLHEELTTVEPGKPFYMLLLGIDHGEGRENMEEYGDDWSNYRTDTIILARIDPRDVKVTLVSIHRDTAVIMDEHGKQKINAAYSFGGEAYVTKVVSEFSGVPISHYADVDFYGMCEIVDAIGGIEVNVPVDVIDEEYTDTHIYAGEQTLNGEQALQLCRARHAYDAYGDGDLYRAANQRMVISAILKKILHQDPITMVNTINQLASSVNTDLAISDLLDLANQFRGMDTSTDIMSGMNPTDGELVDGVWWEISNNAAWQQMMQRVNNGLPPYESVEQDETRGISGSIDQIPDQGAIMEGAAVATSTEATDFSGSVMVYNTTGVEGVAGQVAEHLNGAGFTAEADTAEGISDVSSVVYAPGQRAKALAVIQSMGWSIEPYENDGSFVMSTDVIAVLGLDAV